MPKFQLGSEVQVKKSAGGELGFAGGLKEIQERGTVGKVDRYSDWNAGQVAVTFPVDVGVRWFLEDELDSAYLTAIGGAPDPAVQRRSAVQGYSGVGMTQEQTYVLAMKVTPDGEFGRVIDPLPHISVIHDLLKERAEFDGTPLHRIEDDADGEGFTIYEAGRFYVSYRVFLWPGMSNWYGTKHT